jgi:hypothetical protein
MKQGQSSKRPRSHRGSGRRQNGGRNTNFESSGPQGKIRGTAHQVIEKYQALGRDALTFGDRVAAENFFQHAEHYYRVMVANGGLEQQRGRMGRPGAGEEAQPYDARFGDGGMSDQMDKSDGEADEQEPEVQSKPVGEDAPAESDEAEAQSA